MNDRNVQKLILRLCDTSADVVFFPVRHHSPAAAILVERLIAEIKPSSVLIEGPADFNEHIDELFLDHELPISIYSYFQSSVVDPVSGEAATSQHGAFYPFCDYSPEWVALQTARRHGIEARFIDLPWAQVAFADQATHRYADAELRYGLYVQLLCERLQAEGFDDLWDRLVESQIDLTLEDYLERVHSLCFNTRLWQQEVRESDQIREAYMAQAIQSSLEKAAGPVLVVTGGFHSSALAARLESLPCPGIEVDELSEDTTAPISVTHSGIALTSYTYQRLDGQRGYNAGMPNPGFYDRVWQQRKTASPFLHHDLLESLVTALRKRKQVFSTADLIAVETTAIALAAIRGRSQVWRTDLSDAVTSCLIKDEIEYGCDSPFVDAVNEVLRGDRRGTLAEGTRVPPLVDDVRQQLKNADIEMTQRTTTIELDLLQPQQAITSRLFHRLGILGIAGFSMQRGVDFLTRDDLVDLHETWAVRWSPGFDSTCVEAARFGPALQPAVAACLSEQVSKIQRGDSASAAVLLVRAAQAGTETISQRLLLQIDETIGVEPEFIQACQTTGHLHFLYAWDEALGTQGLDRLGPLLKSAFERSLWLLESLGASGDNDGKTIRGIKTLHETHQRSARALGLDSDEFAEVMHRIQVDAKKPAHLRGAAAGVLWSRGRTEVDTLLEILLEFSSPESLGDFLTGLFKLAREVAQRNPQLVRAIDGAVEQFGAEDFQAALPSLRLAFTSFAPREKHHMLQTLFTELGIVDAAPLRRLEVDSSIAAEALAIEEKLFEMIEKYGVIG